MDIDEYIEFLDERYSKSEVIEILNDLLYEVNKYPKQFSQKLDDKINTYATDNQICSECGCSEFETQRYIEDTDADGQRGRNATYYTCKNCGNTL